MEGLTSAHGSLEGAKAGPSSSKFGIEEQVNESANVTTKKEHLDRKWVSSIKERLCIERGRIEESSSSFSCSIYRVPHYLRQYNEKAYNPQVISIGPLHYEKRKSQLQDMEGYKWRYLYDILSRNGDGSLERYLAAVKELEERARKCYSEVISLDSNSFVEMMVLDACFIIELFHSDDSEEHNGDPIHELEWLKTAVMKDLVMLEYQIPFFVLHHLFDLINDSTPHSIQEIASYLFPDLDSTRLEKLKESDIQIQHLLHLIHANFTVIAEDKCSERSAFQRIPCASKLREAGIKFKRGLK